MKRILSFTFFLAIIPAAWSSASVDAFRFELTSYCLFTGQVLSVDSRSSSASFFRQKFICEDDQRGKLKKQLIYDRVVPSQVDGVLADYIHRSSKSEYPM